MKCENDKEQLTLYMNDQMTNDERAAFEVHLGGCAECRHELEGNRQVWDLLAEIPVAEPSENMQVRFNAMLDVYKDSVNEAKSSMPGFIERIKRAFTLQPAFALAYSVILIVAGFGVGYLFNRPAQPGNIGNITAQTAAVNTEKPQIDSLTAQVHEMKEMVMLSLLQNPSASERIRGVSYTSEINRVNNNVVTALLSTLNNDPNINVRLMTLEALTHFANNPSVREGLVESIMQQDSPLLQSALADAMLKLQEKRSVQPFKTLLKQKDLNNMVRVKIEQTIDQLI